MPVFLYISPTEKVCSKSSSPENSGISIQEEVKGYVESEGEDIISSDLFLSIENEDELVMLK